jgi:23S rRNA (uracil1939-C5)-methyltransferase
MKLTITDPAYGPFAIGRRDDGKVCFVRDGVPGDVVEVEIQHETKSRLEGTIRNLIEPSPHRCEPACSARPECGGCPWMEIQYSAQLEYKQQVLDSVLQRLPQSSSIPSSLSPSSSTFLPSSQLGYRQRARLHFSGDADQALRIGFFSHGTHDIVPITKCPICLPALSDAIGSLARFAPSRSLAGAIELVMDDQGQVMAVFYLSRPVPDPPALAEELGAGTSLAGCLVMSPRSGRGKWGLGVSQMTVLDQPPVSVPIFPAGFSQANREVNRLLVKHVVDTANAFPGPKEMLELYAGHGNFTWPLAAHGWQVQAVETGLRLDLLPRHEAVRFTRQQAAHFLARCITQKWNVPILLLDPPRQGAKDAIPHIITLAPDHIIYVSCDPNTFARDAGNLLTAGYQLQQLTPFDMMPQTYHFELVGVFGKA